MSSSCIFICFTEYCIFQISEIIHEESEVVHHGQELFSLVAAELFRRLFLFCELSGDSCQLRSRLLILKQTNADAHQDCTDLLMLSSSEAVKTQSFIRQALICAFILAHYNNHAQLYLHCLNIYDSVQGLLGST